MKEKNGVLKPEFQKRPTFWQWYFPRHPIIILRVLLFLFFINFIPWNIYVAVRVFIDFFIFYKWIALGITLVFFSSGLMLIAGLIIIPIMAMQGFYEVCTGKYKIKNSWLKFLACIGLLLSPFLLKLGFIIITKFFFTLFTFFF